MDPSDHAEHEGSHLASGKESQDSHGAAAGADGHMEHSQHDAASSDASAGAAGAHDDHGADAGGHNNHDAGGSGASAGRADGHEDHDGGTSSDHGDDTDHGDDDGHGGEPDTVSNATKTRVLGGFGVVNAAAVGGAFLLRRRDRRSTTKPGRVRGSRRDGARRTR